MFSYAHGYSTGGAQASPVPIGIVWKDPEGGRCNLAEGYMASDNSGRRIVGDERQSLAEQYQQQYQAGQSIRAIAEASGRSYGFVHRVLSENGVELRARGGDTKRRTS